MVDRRSVSLVFFDLPMATNPEVREYNRFRRYLKKSGYRLLQKSVYIKLIRDGRDISFEIARIESQAPKQGNVCIIPFSLVSFRKVKLLGESTFDMSYFSDDIIFI